MFSQNLINTKIIISEGKKNPFSLGFDLIRRCISESEDTLDEYNVK